MGKTVPERFELFHFTNPDDPPDLKALGLGWECTEFPPNQSAISKVHRECGPVGMIVPGYSETGSDIKKIRSLSRPYMASPAFVTVDQEIAALAKVFLGKVIGGAKSKDIPGNDILLLDHRQEPWMDRAEEGIRVALQQQQPQHIKIIVLVGYKRQKVGVKSPIPCSILFYKPDP